MMYVDIEKSHLFPDYNYKIKNYDYTYDLYDLT